MNNSALRTGLIGTLVVLQVLTIAVFFGAGWAQRERTRIDHMQQVLQRAGSESQIFANGFLARAERITDQTTALVDSGTLDIDDRAAMTAFLAEQLRANDALARVYIGDRDGNLLQVSRSPRGPALVRVTRVAPSESPMVDMRDIDSTGATVWREVGHAFRDHPGGASWFQLALSEPGAVWTDAFLPHDAGGLAATVAREIDGASGDVVAAVDLDLTPLSRYMSSLNISPSGRALIVDGGAHVVAAPAAVEGGAGERRPVADDATLTAASALGESGASATFSTDGVDYRSAARSLNGPPWRVVVLAPEHDFIGDLQSAERRSITWAGAMVVVAVLLVALVFSRTLLRPFHNLERRARTDSLTGLPNRVAVGEAAERMLGDPSATLGVALIELDDRPDIGNQHGKQCRERAQAHIAREIASSMRDSDVVGCWEGSRFLAVMNTASPQVLLDVLGRVAARVRDGRFTHEGVQVPLTVSIGAAVYPAHGRSVDALIENAERALQMVTYTGRNGVRVYGGDSDDRRRQDALSQPDGAA